MRERVEKKVFEEKKMITASTSQRSVIALPSRLETVLEKIYSKHKCPPISEESRQRLSSIPEEIAFDLLRKAFNSPGTSSLDRFIASKLTSSYPPPGSSRSRVSQGQSVSIRTKKGKQSLCI